MTPEELDQATQKAREEYGATAVICIPIWVNGEEDIDMMLCSKGVPPEGLGYVLSRIIQMTTRKDCEVIEEYKPITPTFFGGPIPEA